MYCPFDKCEFYLIGNNLIDEKIKTNNLGKISLSNNVKSINEM